MSNDPFAQFNLDLPNFPDAGCASSVFEPDTWFPESIRDAEARESQVNIAKFFCGKCVHQLDCLQFALDNDIADGIWGGVLPEERASRKREIRTAKVRSQKLSDIRDSLARGISLEVALAEVGLAYETFVRYQWAERAGWPKEISKKERTETKC